MHISVVVCKEINNTTGLTVLACVVQFSTYLHHHKLLNKAFLIESGRKGVWLLHHFTAAFSLLAFCCCIQPVKTLMLPCNLRVLQDSRKININTFLVQVVEWASIVHQNFWFFWFWFFCFQKENETTFNNLLHLPPKNPTQGSSDFVLFCKLLSSSTVVQ